jgi:hypothetical protein
VSSETMRGEAGAERGGEMKGTGVERTGQGRDEER